MYLKYVYHSKEDELQKGPRMMFCLFLSMLLCLLPHVLLSLLLHLSLSLSSVSSCVEYTKRQGKGCFPCLSFPLSFSLSPCLLLPLTPSLSTRPFFYCLIPPLVSPPLIPLILLLSFLLSSLLSLFSLVFCLHLPSLSSSVCPPVSSPFSPFVTRCSPCSCSVLLPHFLSLLYFTSSCVSFYISFLCPSL